MLGSGEMNGAVGSSTAAEVTQTWLIASSEHRRNHQQPLGPWRVCAPSVGVISEVEVLP